MAKVRLTILIAVATCALAIFLGADLLNDSAYSIDNGTAAVPHWNGTPLPPCFQHASTCWGHLLGTDEVGRDLLARLLVGARTSIANSTVAIVVYLAVATLLLVLARHGGRVGHYVASRVADAASAFPPWPFIITIGFLFGSNMRAGLGLFCASVLGVILAPNLFRTTAKIGIGSEIYRQIGRDWVTALLTLATVDFFGLGVQPPTPSLGNMLAGMQSYVTIAWWAAVFPGVALFLIALCVTAVSRVLPPSSITGEVQRSQIDGAPAIITFHSVPQTCPVKDVE